MHQVRPGGGRLQCVHHHGVTEKRVAQVGLGVTVAFPRPPHRLSQREAPIVAAYLQRQVPLLSDPFGITVEAQQHQGAVRGKVIPLHLQIPLGQAVGQAAQAVVLVAQHDGGGRLGRIREAYDGRMQLGALHQIAESGDAVLQAVEEDAAIILHRRQGMDTHRGLGDETVGALGADEQLQKAGAGSGGGRVLRLDDAVRGDDPHGLGQVLDLAIADGILTGRAGGDPAAEGGELEGLGEVAQREALRVQLGFHLRSGRAGLDASRA